MKFLWNARVLALAAALAAVGCGGRSAIDSLPPAPPAVYSPYVGEYVGADTVIVLEREGVLHLWHAGADVPLESVGGDSYVAGGAAPILFERAADGGVRSLRTRNQTLARVRYDDPGATFRIRPLRPVNALRAEALAAVPPVEEGNFREPALVEPTALDPTIQLDIRYATTNNFMGSVFYSAPRAYLQRPAAEALVRAHDELRQFGYGIVIHDAYRPWYVTKMFWDATPDSLREFVADPARGSLHNRGAAVDLSLYDLYTGLPVEMVSGYDEFSRRSAPDYPGGTSLQRWHRELLRGVMEAEGFTVNPNEWWHFDHRDWMHYRIGTLTFEQIEQGL